MSYLDETLPWRIVPEGKTDDGRDTHNEGDLVIAPYRARHIVTVHGQPVCEFIHDEGDARRITACVNACKGIPTEALECQSKKEITPMMIGLIEEMALLMRWAIANGDLANNKGNPILSAWRDDAEAVISKARGIFHNLVDAPGQPHTASR